MVKDDLVIRVAGESGEGIQSTGQLLAQAAARGGFEVLTYWTVPAEIKGGHALFQVRLSRKPLFSQGDLVDILLAFDQEAYDRNIDELRSGGLLIYDPAEFVPPAGDNRRQIAFPVTDIAKNQLRFERGKNVVALAAAAALFGLPTEYLNRLVKERFGKYGDQVLAQNYAAVEAGLKYIEENFPQRDEFDLGAPGKHPDKMIVTGNQLLAMGAMAAGLGFFAGYPITPASDIMEFLASELPKVGGAVIQAEDEISAMTMVIGASFAGRKAMTSTSGPGLSLMIEALGLATMAELPVVVVDAQRAGPSTGLPTKHEQGDLYLATVGGHGEVPRIVLAPTSVSDCFSLIIDAFNLAETYQTPVILLTDIILAMRMESVDIPDLDNINVKNRLLYQPNGAPGPESGYLRYDLAGENGVSPISIPGMEGGQYIATGLEHNENSRPRYDPATHSRMTEKRFHKLKTAMADAPPAVRYGDPSAETGIITWGSTTGVVIEAMNRLQDKGLALDMIAPRMLRPLPDHQLAEFIRSKRIVIVPEVNYSGQLADLLCSHYPREYQRINVYGGVPFNVSELVEDIENAVKRVSQHV